MKPRALQLVLAAILVACAVGIALSTAQRPEITIRIAFLASIDDEDYVGARAFEQHVERASGGRIGVQIYPSGQFCGNERECIEAMRSGILEIHMTTVGGLANLFGAAQALDLPYVMTDDATAACVYDGPLAAELRRTLIDNGSGLRLMAVGDTGGWRAIGTTQRPVRAPADLAGLRMRTTPAPLDQEIVRNLGAIPTPVPWSEVYTALGVGLLDATKNSVQDLTGMRFQEYVKHLTLDRSGYMAAFWWYSQRRWEKLPADLKPVVEAGFAELARATRRAAKEREAPALEAFRVAGGVVHVPTDAELEVFRAATAPTRAWYTERFGREWLDRFDAAVAACRTSEEIDSR